MATQHLSPVPSAPAVSHAYPMAKPGYGKRNAPDQRPPAHEDFALLPARERYVAGFIDRLPQGAAMSVKQLAKHLPLYGQQAIGTSLNSLSVAGHLRRVRSRLTTGTSTSTGTGTGTGTGAGTAKGKGGEVRWTFRTFWSRTARDNEWWNAYLATAHATQTIAPADIAAPTPPWTPPTGGLTPCTTADERQRPSTPTQAQAAPPTPEAATAVPQQRTPTPASAPHGPPHRDQPRTTEDVADAAAAPDPERAPTAPAAAPVQASPTAGEIPATFQATPEPSFSDAYLALARLGRNDHRLALSAADCTTLEPLATAWLARGVTVDYLTTALTAGLPAHIDSPAGLLHRRLTDKIPPHIPRATEDRSPGTKEPTHEALLVECTNCRRPGPPQALPDGLCHPCHHAHTHGGEPTAPTPDEVASVKAHVANLRNLLKPA
ncbi:MarR family transcriptional regulator [Streptomyces violaceoruber]|uniref:MarR family transcriptional regulator n=1 Tax=Streptomyces violaceoruber TaxID=1935 RepID=UPI001F42256C|nr:MarR family transcriptional regulator [Streptomyces violaceoruber]MCF3169868.1 MarR family transcriptional regulator [Streptomyces violaceoruber]